MKKILLIILTISVILCSCAAFAACDTGKQPQTSTTEGTTVETETKPTETTTAVTTDTTETAETTEETTTAHPETTGSSEQTETSDTETDTETDPSDKETTETETERDNMPEANSTLTVEQAVAVSALLENREFTEGKYFVVGIVESIYAPAKGNMTIVDEKGNTININTSYSADG